MGEAAYRDLCEKFVENAQGQTGQYPTALAAAQSQALRQDFENMKPGDRVYYGAAPENGGAGHAAIYNGDGTVVSSASARPTPVTGYFNAPLLGFAPGPGNTGGPAASGPSPAPMPTPTAGPAPSASPAAPTPSGGDGGGDARSQFMDFVHGLSQKVGDASSALGTTVNNIANANPDELITNATSGLTDIALNQAALTDEQRAQVKAGAQGTVGNVASGMLAQGAQNVSDITSGNIDRAARGASNQIGYGGLSGAGEEAAASLGSNLNKAHLPGDVLPAVDRTYTENAAAIDAGRRGVVPDAQTLADAQSLANASGNPVQAVIDNWQPGDVQNNAMMVAVRNALVDAQRQATAAADKWSADPSGANQLFKMTAQAAADRTQTVVQGLTAEMGRGLRAMGIDVTDPLVIRQLADNPSILTDFKSQFQAGAPIGQAARDARLRPTTGPDAQLTEATPQQQSMLPGLEEPAIGGSTVQANAKPFAAEAGTPQDITALTQDQTGRASTLDATRLPGLGPGALNVGSAPQDRQAVLDMVQAARSGPSWAERGAATAATIGKVADKALAYRYANLLSDPMTHLVNVAGNATATAFGPIEDIAAGRPTIAAMRTFGTIAGVRQGVGDALRVLADGTTAGREGVQEALGGGLKNPLNYPGRALGAADALFGALNSRAEMFAQAAQDATRRGLTPGSPQWRQSVANFVTDPTLKAFQAATDAQKYRTFQGAMTGWEQNMENLARTAGGKLIMPFFRTPWNMVKFSLERSPAGLVNVGKEMVLGHPEAARTALGRAAAGSALMFGLTQLANEGLITGATPTDRTEADRWQREGIQPNSIKIAGKWIDYRLAGPFTVHFAAAAAISKAMQEGDSVPETAALTTLSASRAFIDLPFLRGVADLYDAINGRTQDATAASKAQQILSGYARSAAPLAGFWHFIARATDRTLRDPQNPVEAAYAELPGASQFVQPQVNAFGQPKQRPADQVGLGSLNPLRPATETTDPVEMKIRALADAGLKSSPGFVGKTANVYGQDVKLSDSEQRTYQQRSGQLAYDYLATNVIGTPDFEKLPPEQQAKRITQVVDAARQTVREQQMPQLAQRVTPAFTEYGQKYRGVTDPRREREIDQAVTVYNRWNADRKNEPKPPPDQLALARHYADSDMLMPAYVKARTANTKANSSLRGGIDTSALQFSAP
jgi:hypothetical protein